MNVRIASNVSGYFRVGAIADRATDSTMNNFINDATVMGEAFVGGMVGHMYGTARGCHAC